MRLRPLTEYPYLTDLYVVSSRQHRGLYQNAPERRIELPVQERKSVRLVCYGFHY